MYNHILQFICGKELLNKNSKETYFCFFLFLTKYDIIFMVNKMEENKVIDELLVKVDTIWRLL